MYMSEDTSYNFKRSTSIWRKSVCHLVCRLANHVACITLVRGIARRCHQYCAVVSAQKLFDGVLPKSFTRKVEFEF